jgi:hypothetical protein
VKDHYRKSLVDECIRKKNKRLTGFFPITLLPNEIGFEYVMFQNSTAMATKLMAPKAYCLAGNGR